MTGPDVDVYAVGVLRAMQSVRRLLFVRRSGLPPVQRDVTYGWRVRRAGREIRGAWRYLRRQAAGGNWRAVRNHFNGYLAEPLNDETAARRGWSGTCGTGWTRARAMRSLRREGWSA